jgi:hypothetical protein
MDNEEDQARLHFRSPPNTFGICWEHGGKRDRSHRKVRCDVEDGTAAAFCVSSPHVDGTKQTNTRLDHSTTPRLANAHCKNALIEFPWLEADVQRKKRARTIKVWHF